MSVTDVRTTGPGGARAAGAPAQDEDEQVPTDTAATGPPGRRPRRAASVRVKVLGSVLVMAALGMLVAEVTTFVISDRRLDARIDAALEQEIEEFRVFAAQGVDPETGRPFTALEPLFETALQRNVADENETFLTMVDGDPFLLPGGGRPIDLEDEPAVLDLVRSIPPGADVRRADVETSQGTVRLAAVQVAFAGLPATGTYVVAHVVDREREELIDSARTYTFVSLGALLLVALVGWLVAGRLLRPLRVLREATYRITEADLTERIPVTGADDVSDLTRTYNDMLDRLQSAFETQRQFIDDAGHELRTPVTIVRGHLELLDPADPAEVVETRDLVLDEVDRVGRLVEDLILLAQARRPDFIRPGTVELGRLTDEVLDKARALGDRTWRVDARAEATVPGDAQRLTQALLQLASNAVKFSEPGSQVAVGSAITGDEAWLWVRDTGVGIHPDDAARIFARFGRAETGRGVEGSGLGLAIVSAIAEAHNGRVVVESRPGAGATFTLTLPCSPATSPAESTHWSS